MNRISVIPNHSEGIRVFDSINNIYIFCEILDSLFLPSNRTMDAMDAMDHMDHMDERPWKSSMQSMVPLEVKPVEIVQLFGWESEDI